MFINPEYAAKVHAKSEKRTEGVRQHEEAHAAAAGPFGSGINIVMGSNELGKPEAKSGNVKVAMPAKADPRLPNNEIDNIITHARTVARAARAPEGLGDEAGQLSDADIRVYNQAMVSLSMAESIKAQKKPLRVSA